MPTWEITDLNGNSHSVDLTKQSINSINDVKDEFKKFDQKKILKDIYKDLSNISGCIANFEQDESIDSLIKKIKDQTNYIKTNLGGFN